MKKKTKSNTKVTRQTHSVLPVRGRPKKSVSDVHQVPTQSVPDVPAPRAAGSSGSWDERNKAREPTTLDNKNLATLEGPRTPNARYVLVQIEVTLEDPGRAVLDACRDAGLPVLTVWTDPGFMKRKIDSLPI